MPRADIGGLELEYAEFCASGRASAAPVLIMIRGLGTQMTEWSPVLLDGLVDAGFRVVVFDNRDAGLSDAVEADYTLDDMANDVIGLQDALGIARASLFGISLGGMVAQLVACHWPERVQCLFSVMSTSGDPGLPQAAPEVRARLMRAAAGREAIIALSAESRAVFGSPAYPESPAARAAAATAAYDRAYRPAGVARQISAVLADGSRAARLARIRVPTLVIHGADDPLIPVAAGEHTAQLIPGARLEIVPGMGHNLPDALASRIVELVRGFVAAHPDPLP